LHAPAGTTATGTAIIGNQSFTALSVVGVCATANTVQASANVCSAAPSNDFDVKMVDASGAVKPIGSLTVPPWSLQTLQVSSKASTAKQTYGGLLHVVYCQGNWDAAKGCTEGALQVQSVSLTGSTDVALKAPKLELTLDPALPLLVGKPLRVFGKVTDATWEGQGFIWMVGERPADSKVWLDPTNTSTTMPVLDDFVPDKSGKYTLLGTVQIFDLVDAANQAFSAPAKLTFTVP
jgi:hypothetical protein